jgi:hypothetical protein
VRKEVAAHSTCWGKTGPPPREGIQAKTTRERWQHVHDLLDKGVGLLEIARRLNLALNTVKRYARISEPQRLIRAPKYRPTLVDPFRDHLRRRRDEDPAVPVLVPLADIRQLGYTGSQNLLYRYITQGRVESDRPAISPPDLAHADPRRRSSHVHAFTGGLESDRHAVNAALTQPFHNGRTEGINRKTKVINERCTDAQAPPSSATASCSAELPNVTTECGPEPFAPHLTKAHERSSRKDVS